MILYLSIAQVLQLHRRQLALFGGSGGLRDRGGLEAAVARPRMTFGGEDLYPTLAAKATALGFSLILNHPFVDGNKRVGHAALETFLILNGSDIDATQQDKYTTLMALADGRLTEKQLAGWIRSRMVTIQS